MFEAILFKGIVHWIYNYLSKDLEPMALWFSIVVTSQLQISRNLRNSVFLKITMIWKMVSMELSKIVWSLFLNQVLLQEKGNTF